MTTRATLPSKAAGETVSTVFDFTSRLAVGETISTQVCTAAVWSGVDPSPSAVISGAATASGAKVTQKLAAGVLGVIYYIVCTITTSLGQTLEMAGYLAVVPEVV